MKSIRYVIININDIIVLENPQKIAQSSRSNIVIEKKFLRTAGVAVVIEEKKILFEIELWWLA